ncbi:MAG: endonuclease III, partial [Bacteroidales bacterium]|nr:endonuclease III [Bacteroidales bacterium]
MELTERYSEVLRRFEEVMPVAEPELNFDSPFHLLIAVILSAQCTDRRVNMHT